MIALLIGIVIGIIILIFVGKGGKAIDFNNTLLEEGPEEFQNLERRKEKVIEFLAAENPELAKTLKRVRDCGSEQERQLLLKEFQGNIQSLLKMVDYVKGGD